LAAPLHIWPASKLHPYGTSPKRGTLPDGQGVPLLSLEEIAMRDIHQDVTDKLFKALNQGFTPGIKTLVLKWLIEVSYHHPFPNNAITRRPYSGINLRQLWAMAKLQ
jgi:hypothetical protein